MIISPEETFPCGEVSAFEKCVFQNAFNSPQSLDHVSTVVVEIPQFSVMSLMCPPERILLQHLSNQNTRSVWSFNLPYTLWHWVMVKFWVWFGERKWCINCRITRCGLNHVPGTVWNLSWLSSPCHKPKYACPSGTVYLYEGYLCPRSPPSLQVWDGCIIQNTILKLWNWTFQIYFVN